jgi:4-amino-4-deoxy-L-arabinose transferase-like glycosyltransferase
MSRADRFALLLSLMAVFAAFVVANRVFEGMAHLEDEMAYLWQAQVIAGGHLTVPSPSEPDSFLVPFVVDYQGQRFAKYPLGWPVVLALGERLGVRTWVNALLAGFSVWLTYRLGKKVLGETVGLLAALLTLTSPFFLMNSGSLLSHPFGLVLSAFFAIAWLDAFGRTAEAKEKGFPRPWLAALTAALTLGTLTLTRPFTALVVGLPFGVHGIWLLVRGTWQVRRRLLGFGLALLCLAGLHFAWQYAVTGDAFLNPYTLWWSYDKVGFGPGHGHLVEGHTLNQAWINTRFSLWVGNRDLFGWAAYSWIFLPFGLLAIRRKPKAWLLASVFPWLVVCYMAYWIGSSLFGPRYFYEGLFSLTLLSAAGIAWLAGWPVGAEQSVIPGAKALRSVRWLRVRRLGMTGFLALLICASAIFYTPMRLKGMFGLYGVQRAYLEPFLTPSAQEMTPALIIVHTKHNWIEYGTLVELETPYLDTPFIFIRSLGAQVDARVTNQFPERAVYHYYLDQPYLFYTEPRPAR